MPGSKTGEAAASERIDKQIAELRDWRGPKVAELRRLIHEADPDVVEEWKWDTGVWSHGGSMMVAVAAFKDKVKLNFFNGASLPDPRKLFNAGLESKKARSIDIRDGDKVDEKALKELIRTAAKQAKK